MLAITKVMMYLNTVPYAQVAGIMAATGCSENNTRKVLSAARKAGILRLNGRWHGDWGLLRDRIERPQFTKGGHDATLILAGVWASIGNTKACAPELSERLGVKQKFIGRAIKELRNAGLITRGPSVAGLQFYKRT